MEPTPKSHPSVLVVDDDPGLLMSIKATLVSAGMPEPTLVSDSRKVMDLMGTLPFALVLLDLNMPHVDGLTLLEQIKSTFPETECIVVTATDDAPTAVKAMRFGAYDYLVKPLNAEKLIIVTSRALERHSLRSELDLYRTRPSFSDLRFPEAFADIVAEDEAMALVFRQVEVVAPTDYNVVITGESGTGKEMLARVIHRLSSRNSAPFLAVNMAAFNRAMFEDAFFGHTRGAYTDARDEKPGFFEAAQGGTLFLDEVTELDPPLQGKLLRVIEERELYRLGSTRVRDVDVRIVSATNRNISEEIREGRFRADLFYRLNTYCIRIPPLRERKGDILPLVRHFMRIHAAKNRKRIDSVTPKAADRLRRYRFPGNVRELENLIAAAVLLEKGTRLHASSLVNLEPDTGEETEDTGPLMTLAEMERRHLKRVLQATGGNRKEAARILGVNITTVYRKIEKYRLDG